MIKELAERRPEVHTDGAAGPYLLIEEDRQAAVEAALRAKGVRYYAEPLAISLGEAEPFMVTVYFGVGADVGRVRAALDAVTPDGEDAP